jgi:hypothetical protein
MIQNVFKIVLSVVQNVCKIDVLRMIQNGFKIVKYDTKCT